MGGRPGPRREARRAAADAGDRLTTVRAAVEYDGTAFCGFQWQPSVRTVGGTLEAALVSLLREPVAVAAAGRTDTGVHATGQVISFSTSRSFPFERLAIALASELPRDVSVRDVTIVANDFSARFSARERSYVFAIYNRREPSALLAHRAYHVWKPLDLDAMRTAAASLIGEHDFRSFCGMLPESGPTIRTVHRLELERRGDLIRIEINGSGFLHRMVRTIVGTLVECGAGRRDPASMPAILAAKAREAAGLTAPPQGLYLAGVRYEDGYDSYREPPIFPSQRFL